MEVRLIQTADYPAWDAYVLACGLPSVYLTTAWKQAVESGYARPTTYLAAFDNDSVVGVLPLVLIRSCLVSLPYCDYGGLIAESDEVAGRLLDRGLDLAAKRRAVLEIRSAGPVPVVERRAGFLPVTNKCRMVLELPRSAAMLWEGFKSKLRTKVNLAIKHGLVHRMGGKELLPDFYRVFSRNMAPPGVAGPLPELAAGRAGGLRRGGQGRRDLQGNQPGRGRDYPRARGLRNEPLGFFPAGIQ